MDFILKIVLESESFCKVAHDECASREGRFLVKCQSGMRGLLAPHPGFLFPCSCSVFRCQNWSLKHVQKSHVPLNQRQRTRYTPPPLPGMCPLPPSPPSLFTSAMRSRSWTGTLCGEGYKSTCSCCSPSEQIPNQSAAENNLSWTFLSASTVRLKWANISLCEQKHTMRYREIIRKGLFLLSLQWIGS